MANNAGRRRPNAWVLPAAIAAHYATDPDPRPIVGGVFLTSKGTALLVPHKRRPGFKLLEAEDDAEDKELRAFLKSDHGINLATTSVTIISRKGPAPDRGTSDLWVNVDDTWSGPTEL